MPSNNKTKPNPNIEVGGANFSVVKMDMTSYVQILHEAFFFFVSLGADALGKGLNISLQPQVGENTVTNFDIGMTTNLGEGRLGIQILL